MDKKFKAARLRALLNQPGECFCCPLSDETLGELLTLYPRYELAAYHACVMLSQESAMRMSDGMTTPSQRDYWLRRALAFRPNRGGCVGRADEKVSGVKR